jgi:dTDP-4-dehydrorhamnose 3,5-epimerase
MAQLDGVSVTTLKIIPDDRGQVMHVLRADAPHFKKFGEVYLSSVYPNAIKGWKFHTLNQGNIAVPKGRVKFVLYDLRDGSPTKHQFQEVFLGDNNYCLLTIPAGIAYGWKNLLPEIALLVNCASEAHQPGESVSFPLDQIPYSW